MRSIMQSFLSMSMSLGSVVVVLVASVGFKRQVSTKIDAFLFLPFRSTFLLSRYWAQVYIFDIMNILVSFSEKSPKIDVYNEFKWMKMMFPTCIPQILGDSSKPRYV